MSGEVGRNVEVVDRQGVIVINELRVKAFLNDRMDDRYFETVWEYGCRMQRNPVPIEEYLAYESRCNWIGFATQQPSFTVELAVLGDHKPKIRGKMFVQMRCRPFRVDIDAELERLGHGAGQGQYIEYDEDHTESLRICNIIHSLLEMCLK